MHTNRNNCGPVSMHICSNKTKKQKNPNKHVKKNRKAPMETLKMGYRTILHLYMYLYNSIIIDHYICGSPCLKQPCCVAGWRSSGFLFQLSNSPWCTQMVRELSISVWNQTAHLINTSITPGQFKHVKWQMWCHICLFKWCPLSNHYFCLNILI